jgi:8-oxo-dGTP diphosphatase
MAAVALIIRENKFLLIKRAEQDKDPWSGQMALPGGHREIGETCEKAAIRETLEEVGIPIHIDQFLGIYHTLNMHVSVAAFKCRASTSDVHIDSEVSRYFWVSEKDLIKEDETYKFGDYIIFGLTYRILYDYFNLKF